MDPQEFFAASRAFLAAEYLHNRRMIALVKGTGGEYYHRKLMVDARKKFLHLMAQKEGVAA